MDCDGGEWNTMDSKSFDWMVNAFGGLPAIILDYYEGQRPNLHMSVDDDHASEHMYVYM